MDALLRGELLTALAVFGHDSTKKEALERFSAFLEDRNTPRLPPDTRKVSCLLLFMFFILIRVSHEVTAADICVGGVCCCDAKCG